MLFLSYSLILYVKGNTEILGKLGIAVIGCRDNTKYGELIAKNLGYNLAKHGINVISGLAKGVDSFAHIGAIYAKGKTIAVLGDGLDRIYPKENIKIAEKILEYGGAIVSEYPIGTSIDKMHFLERNRIIHEIQKEEFDNYISNGWLPGFYKGKQKHPRNVTVFWICNDETKESKWWKKTEPIPDGWRKGRYIEIKNKRKYSEKLYTCFKIYRFKRPSRKP